MDLKYFNKLSMLHDWQFKGDGPHISLYDEETVNFEISFDLITPCKIELDHNLIDAPTKEHKIDIINHYLFELKQLCNDYSSLLNALKDVDEDPDNTIKEDMFKEVRFKVFEHIMDAIKDCCNKYNLSFKDLCNKQGLDLSCLDLANWFEGETLEGLKRVEKEERKEVELQEITYSKKAPFKIGNKEYPLAERFYIMDNVLDLSTIILKLNTQARHKHQLLAMLLNCDPDNAKHLINGTYPPQSRMTKERKEELDKYLARYNTE